MTAVWGPLGWMTLHSVSSIYPENPTDSEKTLMSSWLDMFRDTITCHHCKSHFTEMLDTYRIKFPMILNSRQEFMAFAFRAHNTVNRRLNKPIYDSVEQCMSVLKNNIRNKSAREYRNAYLNHIKRYWGTLRDMSGISALRKITEMIKIEADYFASRDTNFDVQIGEITVVFPYGVLEKMEENSIGARFKRQQQLVNATQIINSPTVIERPKVSVGFIITSKGIQLRR